MSNATEGEWPSDSEAPLGAVFIWPKTVMNRRPIDKDSLEGIIDLHNLTDVVTMLAEICAEKAEHIDSKWKDGKLAGKWYRASVQLDQLAPELPRMW
jgi:hypothetical protein